MQFSREQTHYIWEKFLEWPVAKNVQFNYYYVARKEAIEIWVFFETLDGERLRTDFELTLQPGGWFKTPYVYNWLNEDIDKMIELIQQFTESTLEDWQKV